MYIVITSRPRAAVLVPVFAHILCDITVFCGGRFEDADPAQDPVAVLLDIFCIEKLTTLLLPAPENIAASHIELVVGLDTPVSIFVTDDDVFPLVNTCQVASVES